MSEGKTLLKWGCLGCLGLLGLAIFVTGGIGAMVWKDVQNESPTTKIASADPGAREPSNTPENIAESLLIVLDVGNADLTLKPVDDDRELRLEATYDERTYKLEETRGTGPDGNPVWTVTFSKISSARLIGLRALFGGTKSTIRIDLPRGMPLAIEGSIRDGALQGDLGGTTLREFDIELHRGAIVLGVADPTTEPMQRFAIDARQGANVIGGLGNASPREIDIGCSMGACVIDLSGDWRNDSTIDLAASMSGAVLSLSEDVIHEGLNDVKGFDRLEPPRSDPEIPPPTLRFNVDGKWEIQ